MLPWAHWSPHPERHLDQFGRFCIAQGRQSLYFTMGGPSPLKIAPSLGDLDPHLTHGFLDPAKSKPQTAYSVVFAVMMIVIDRQTMLHGL